MTSTRLPLTLAVLAGVFALLPRVESALQPADDASQGGPRITCTLPDVGLATPALTPAAPGKLRPAGRADGAGGPAHSPLMSFDLTHLGEP